MGVPETAVDIGDMSHWSPERVGLRDFSADLIDRAHEFRASPTGRNIEQAVVAPIMWVGSLGYFTGALALKGIRPLANGVKERALDAASPVAIMFSEQRGDNLEPLDESSLQSGLMRAKLDKLKGLVDAISHGKMYS